MSTNYADMKRWKDNTLETKYYSGPDRDPPWTAESAKADCEQLDGWHFE